MHIDLQFVFKHKSQKCIKLITIFVSLSSQTRIIKYALTIKSNRTVLQISDILRDIYLP